MDSIGAESSSTTDPLYEFISKETGVKIQRIREECTLTKTFGVDGDDGYYFLVAYANHFSVNCDELYLDDHFWPEGIIRTNAERQTLFQMLTEPPLPKPKQKLPRIETRIPITVLALREGIQQGVLSKEIIEQCNEMLSIPLEEHDNYSFTSRLLRFLFG